ncbi:MAG: ATP synthase F1 subunit gamma [Phycisphaerae bacterium]
MAKARAITKRRKAVRNIRKITQTMQLIATARYAKTLQRATAGKPYTQKITEMIQNLSGVEAAQHPLLAINEGVKQSVLLVITSNRGLCGSYNSSVLRAAVEQRRKLVEAGVTPTLEMVGKKGLGYMRFLRYDVADSITDVEDKIAFSRVAAIADRYMHLYETHQIARVDVVYMRFQSVAVQRAVVAPLLPIEPPKGDAAATGGIAPSAGRGAAGGASSASPGSDSAGVVPAAPRLKVNFEFSPPPEQLLARLIPETVRIRLYQYFNDAIVSEQVSRMVAMKAATDAAGDMIKYLTREYNRARQSQITLELADIVGGAEAVK